jgi:hypothetical protein
MSLSIVAAAVRRGGWIQHQHHHHSIIATARRVAARASSSSITTAMLPRFAPPATTHTTAALPEEEEYNYGRLYSETNSSRTPHADEDHTNATTTVAIPSMVTTTMTNIGSLLWQEFVWHVKRTFQPRGFWSGNVPSVVDAYWTDDGPKAGPDSVEAFKMQ